MNKETKKVRNKEIYLLGADKDGVKYYLEEPSWDCGWYWGFGYVETYINNNTSLDIHSHQHFDCLFLKENCINKWKSLIQDSTLNKKDVWTLMELMNSFYILKETAGLFSRGGSHISENPCKDILENKERSEEINNVLLPAIFDEIKKLFKDIQKDENK